MVDPDGQMTNCISRAVHSQIARHVCVHWAVADKRDMRTKSGTSVLRIERKSGDELKVLLPDMAALRIEVFRDWPYIYEGSLNYEKSYLGQFIEAPDHVAVCAFDDARLVGAATASPLAHQHDEFRAPLEQAGHSPDDIFYFGESVLLPAYRGRGVGHAFFDGREAHALALGYDKMAFCAVVRPDDHPLKPAWSRSLDPFWRKRGYLPLIGVIGEFSWRDIGMHEETSKPMQFWGRGF